MDFLRSVMVEAVNSLTMDLQHFSIGLEVVHLDHTRLAVWEAYDPMACHSTTRGRSIIHQRFWNPQGPFMMMTAYGGQDYVDLLILVDTTKT